MNASISEHRFSTTQRLASPLLITVCLAWLAVPGCRPAGTSELVGTWEMVLDDRSDTDSPDQAEDDRSVVLDGVADGAAQGGMQLVFHGNGYLETITDFPAAQSHKKGRWSLLSWDPSARIAVIRSELSDEVVETRITFVDRNTIELVPPNIDVLETRLRFSRTGQ